MPMWSDDDELMAGLKDALRAGEDVPDQARAAARVAFAWRTVDQELLTLSHDSAVLDDALVRGGSATDARILTFAGHGLSLELELDDGRLIGQVVPGRACRVTLHLAEGPPRSVDADEGGFFSFTDVAPGPARFQVGVDREARTTEWIVL